MSGFNTRLVDLKAMMENQCVLPLKPCSRCSVFHTNQPQMDVRWYQSRLEWKVALTVSSQVQQVQTPCVWRRNIWKHSKDTWNFFTLHSDVPPSPNYHCHFCCCCFLWWHSKVPVTETQNCNYHWFFFSILIVSTDPSTQFEFL